MNIPDLVQIHETDFWRGPCPSCTHWWIRNTDKLLEKWYWQSDDRSMDTKMLEYFKNRHAMICEENNND